MRNTGTLKQSSRLYAWSGTDTDEIMSFFAVLMYMAIDPRTSVNEYWSSNEILQLPGFKRIMSYNRYTLLNKFLHFVDNDVTSSAGLSARLHKMSPIIKHLGKKFNSLYNLGPDLSIDESLTLFKGRLSWAQKIKSKARFGIKSSELYDSRTGYMARFHCYTRKEDSPEDDLSFGVDLGRQSTKVVLKLLQGLEDRGHCVVMDNLNNCPSVARFLKYLGFDCFGALQANRRNIPSDIAKVSKNVRKGTIISRHSGDVSIIAWMDSKMVNIISTYHRPDTYLGTRAGKPLVKPVCIRDYNMAMGGVDLKAQKLSMYLLERKRGVKWYRKMFKRLLNVSIMNAFVMYQSSLKRRGKVSVTHREFRLALAESLVKRHRPCVAEVIAPSVDNVVMRLRRDIVHEPENLAGSSNRSRCMICNRKKITKLVRTKCVQCDVYLCFVGCWKIWHSASELPGVDIRACKRKR
ncbi:hypothetical protein PYW08_009735 [Mythimna loreyi]|uniref:Uncharacterized protein n=1 Tax=Mythimna loreyi TaxID=667449 RepID=A0ACC2Q6V8_9NEOP|nr:hypothetical protein PYW08_009735 [Mythimna loreyi]